MSRDSSPRLGAFAYSLLRHAKLKRYGLLGFAGVEPFPYRRPIRLYICNHIAPLFWG